MKQLSCVLVVDDDPIAIYLNKRAIKQVDDNATIEIASNGAEAIEKILRPQKCDCVSYIFLDLNMPGMDGFEFIDYFNNLDPSQRENVKIIVVSSSQNTKDLQRLEELGVTKIITKPMVKGILEELIEGNQKD